MYLLMLFNMPMSTVLIFTQDTSLHDCRLLQICIFGHTLCRYFDVFQIAICEVFKSVKFKLLFGATKV